MATQEINSWVIERGTTWKQDVYWLNDAGSAQSLSGYSARLKISKAFGTTPVISLNSGTNGGLVITAASGKIAITATPAQTKDLLPGYYVFEVDIYTTTSAFRVARGKIKVEDQVYWIALPEPPS